eukprot:gb/GFBE01054278.1/.p1 GENE.gb/GFBE01054278.1/~~gb/GFBE01054278.1/.p1  ORF type:complete len:287 (+),score=45.27 gb/GFBE01054278.1/:1-861(+)
MPAAYQSSFLIQCRSAMAWRGTSSVMAIQSMSIRNGATTIKLSSLGSCTTVTDLLVQLNDIAPRRYDFVHLSRDRRCSTNSGVAVINFIDHASAKQASERFARDGRVHWFLKCSPRVEKGNVQGLGPNLAYFIVKYGYNHIHHPDAPRVFKHGFPVTSLRDAVNEHVTIAMLETIREGIEGKSGARALGMSGSGTDTTHLPSMARAWSKVSGCFSPGTVQAAHAAHAAQQVMLAMPGKQPGSDSDKQRADALEGSEFDVQGLLHDLGLLQIQTKNLPPGVLAIVRL